MPHLFPQRLFGIVVVIPVLDNLHLLLGRNYLAVWISFQQLPNGIRVGVGWEPSHVAANGHVGKPLGMNASNPFSCRRFDLRQNSSTVGNLGSKQR